MGSFNSQIKILLLIVVQLGLASVVFSQEKKLIRKGNKAYDSQTYKEAEIKYRKALEKNANSFEAKFNLGDAFYKQEKYEEAEKQFEQLAHSQISKVNKAKAFHNLGNSFFKSKKLEESVEAYKNALRNNPNDDETRNNLAYAQRLLKQQQQEQKDQNKDQKENKDEQNKKDNQDKQDKKDQQKKQEDKEQGKKQEQNKDKQDKQKEQQNKKEQKEQKIPKEKAERMLKALENDEKDLQKKLKMQQVKGKKAHVEKDW